MQIRNTSFSLRLIAICWVIVAITIYIFDDYSMSHSPESCAVYNLPRCMWQIWEYHHWMNRRLGPSFLAISCENHALPSFCVFSQGSPSTLNVLCPVSHSKYLIFQDLVMSTVIQLYNSSTTHLNLLRPFSGRVLPSTKCFTHFLLPAGLMSRLSESTAHTPPHQSRTGDQRVDGVEGIQIQDPDYLGSTLD